MAVQPKERLYTADDLWDLSQSVRYAEQRLELIEGELHEMSPAGWLPGEIASELGAQIRLYAKQHGLGRVTAAETGFVLHKHPGGKDTVLAPDVGFISAARVPEKLPQKFVPFAPDLAVEVISPSEKDDKIISKVELYLRYGVRLVWVVYPLRQLVHVYRPGEANQGSYAFLDINSTLDGEDVLPSFQLNLSELFAET